LKFDPIAVKKLIKKLQQEKILNVPQSQLKYWLKNYEIYTEEEFLEDILKIADWARDKNFQGVFGITRGGWGPALWLSHRLDIFLITKEEDITPRVLVVDDILDTGATKKVLCQSVSAKFKMATLYVKEGHEKEVDFYCRVKRDKFIVFPWETLQSAKYDNTKIS